MSVLSELEHSKYLKFGDSLQQRHEEIVPANLLNQNTIMITKKVKEYDALVSRALALSRDHFCISFAMTLDNLQKKGLISHQPILSIKGLCV